jgi:uncharacterized damage-inducible protein DinB
MSIPIPRPHTDEYAPFYAGYVARVPEGADVWALLTQQADELAQLVANLSEEAAGQRPAPAEWSVKEVLGHINDTERIFSYRALRIARNDATPLPGFEQDHYVSATDFNARNLSSHLGEFRALRQANIFCFEALSLDELARVGTASNSSVSARALLYMLAGHVAHHLESLQKDYGLG